MITICFATHRPEMVSLAYGEMLKNDVIILEEPPHPKFTAMLEGNISIANYLSESDMEYPKYEKLLAHALRKLHRKGKKIFQIEPYLTSLYQIHEYFANGKNLDDIKKITGLASVYNAEKEATGSLIQYYKKSVKGSFRELLDSLINFAKVDADRITLRDALRAKQIEEFWKEESLTTKLYIECGYIHFGLFRALHQRLGSKVPIRPLFIIKNVVQPLLGKKQVLGPGDLVTLFFIFKKAVAHDVVDLLAARSLIYTKLLKKNEMVPKSENDFPHTYDEINALKMVNNLDIEDCYRLIKKIRFRKTGDCVCIVQAYLKSKLGH